MCMCVCMHMSTGVLRVQGRVLDPLELQLQAVVSCQTWALGTKLWSSERLGSI